MLFDRITQAFYPITELLAGMAYPIAYIMMSVGIILMICGNKHKGFEVCKWSAIGYIAMQFLPSIMQILAEIGQAMRDGL